MTGPDRADRHSGGVKRTEGPPLHYIVPGALVALLVAVLVVIVTSLGGSAPHGRDGARQATRQLPPYWNVQPGQTYALIAQKTGLSVAQLETFNPDTDPQTLAPGTRLKLRLHVPPPKPKPKGPRYWTVRPGQSYGSIAAKTGHDILALQRLNPGLKADRLHPGDRIKLRP